MKYSKRGTHVAAGQLAVSSGADHAGGDQAAPPVVPAAGVMADNGEAGLLQDVGDGSPSWRKEEDSRLAPAGRPLTPPTVPPARSLQRRPQPVTKQAVLWGRISPEAGRQAGMMESLLWMGVASLIRAMSLLGGEKNTSGRQVSTAERKKVTGSGGREGGVGVEPYRIL